MIKPDHLREYVIRPVLNSMGLWSPSAQELLMLTSANESHCGHYLHQINGPAVGIYQMEPSTHDDIWDNYLSYRGDLAEQVEFWSISRHHDAEHLLGNLYYATAMARVHYLRVPSALPAHSDIDGLARYYKAHYNTAKGSATVDGAIKSYQRYAV